MRIMESTKRKGRQKARGEMVMYKVNIELNGVYKTFDELDGALKKEYSEQEGLEYQLGVTNQEEFEKAVHDEWIRFTDTTTQLWSEEC